MYFVAFMRTFRSIIVIARLLGCKTLSVVLQCQLRRPRPVVSFQTMDIYVTLRCVIYRSDAA